MRARLSERLLGGGGLGLVDVQERCEESNRT